MTQGVEYVHAVMQLSLIIMRKSDLIIFKLKYICMHERNVSRW